ncbi:tail fiber protein [Citrobacter sp. MNAZ 1397]|uniref:tail fiber protein n=1 Tax=Citrobacter sp. MNAZ 1397 TaxID=2911205 RepID=UPI0032EBC083
MHAMPPSVGHTGLFISRFSLSQPFYGGDGVTTFNLPNLHGRMPIGFGQLNTVIHNISDTGGTDNVQLTPILINCLRDTTPIYPQLNLVPHT